MTKDSYENKDTVVFMHENAGNIGLRMDYFEKVYHELGVNILCVAYRGYSRSTGKPTEAGLYQDGQAIYDYISKCEFINTEKIFLLGRSLGGAVAINLIHHLDS